MSTTPTEAKPKKIGRTVLAKYFHDNGYEPIPPHVFYREMFPQGELAPFHEDGSYDPNVWRYNGIILHRTNQTKLVLKHVNFPKKDDLLVTRYVFKKHLVYDDLIAIDRAIEEANSKGEQVYMAPVSYLGRNRDEKHERFLYVLTLEVDDLITEKIPGKRNLRQKGLETALHQWGANNTPRWEGGWFLAPTAVTCSGRGIHCHWFLKEPVPLFGGPTIKECDYNGNVVKQHNRRRKQWKWFRQRFSDYVWNNAVSSSPIQREAIGQSFRMVGSLSKDNKLVEAFWISKKRYSIDELLGLEIFGEPMYAQNGTGYFEDWFDFTTKSQIDLTKHEQKEPEKLLAAKEQWPEWYERRIVHKQPPRQSGHWHIKPDLYEWYKRQIQREPHVGCRYYRLYTIAQYGAKCDIPFEQVKEDCIKIGSIFKLVGDVPLEDWEIEKAYAAYYDYRAFESTIDFINSKAHLNIEKNKRNGQKQYDHLQADVLYSKATGRPTVNTCKTNRALSLQYLRENGLVTGRPAGSGSKREQVEAWQSQHPDGTKMECHRDTGMSRSTIDKWWLSA